MKRLSKQKFHQSRLETIPIPRFDRAKRGARNVLGIIQDKTVDSLYRVLTKHEIINTRFARNQIQERKENISYFRRDAQPSAKGTKDLGAKVS